MSATGATTTVDLMGGTDILNLAGGTETLSVSNTETINGSAATDQLTLSNAQSGTTVDLAGGTDTLNLANGGNTITATNAENINGGTGADVVTLGAAQSSGTIDLGDNTDTDTVNLFNGANTLTITDTEIINGGTGNDTITNGSGSLVTTTVDLGSSTDTYIAGNGSDKIFYSATTDFGDELQSLSLSNSEGPDTIDFNLDNIGVFSGTEGGAGNVFKSVASGGTVDDSGETHGFVVISTAVTDPTSASELVTLANGLTGLGANEDRFFAVGNGTNSRIWHWNDTGDGVVTAGELTAVADLTGIDQTTLGADDFTDFSASGGP